MSIGYVAHAQVTDETVLRPLLTLASADQSEAEESFFFLRWAHRVSGMKAALPETLSPEGQWFSELGELRWKRDRHGYQVLWLGQQRPQDVEQLSHLAWTAIDRQWQFVDQPVLLHDRRTPQFPHLFDYPTRLQNRLRQRYFRDAETDIVHFVALTVHPPQTAPDTAQSS